MHETLTEPQQRVLKSTSDFIIAEGAIRSGKTDVCAMKMIMHTTKYADSAFLVAGKSIGALKRNVVPHLVRWGNVMKQRPVFNRSENRIQLGENNNLFLFGGNNESSQDLVQGLTAAGAMIDEATLQPATFLKQCYGRCSVSGAIIINTLNPAGPMHHFKREYVDKADEVGAEVIHFDFFSNPGLSDEAKDRAQRLFSGVFERRYIKGEWAAAAGAIYPQYTLIDPPANMDNFDTFDVAIDYGPATTTCFLLIGRNRKARVDTIIAEYYHEPKTDGEGKTDAEYSKDLADWLQGFGVTPHRIWIDPAAQGFNITLRRDGFQPRQAVNDVVPGIGITANRLANKQLVVTHECQNLISELDSYVWDEDKQNKGEDAPIKAFDHAMDAMRYFVYSNYNRKPGNPVAKIKGW